MNYYLKAAVMLLSAGLLSSVAMAATSDFNITGTVIAFPCEVDPDSVSQTVDMGHVSTSGLASPNSGHTWKKFDIKVINCPKIPGGKLTAKFQGTPAGDANTLYANTGSAKNVAIQMAQNANPDAIQGNGSTMTVDVSDDGSAMFAMRARLYSEKGGATQGTIESQVQFNFTYQ
ncbi:fimbrial protein [Pluralibacter gergoviae]|uniref:Fimbrial protein n=1 Tax=Pluralibacter gergoviae TaxID=61647 RepID=A0AAW8HYI5_PLUGE|nr:fimbrial protein [Pluralibacter gergoviae]AVR02413.1 type 1 fimbrial protein [Pluralibacter gergoviae]KMK04597.1 hypothetical protein ABW08_10945 [Pluralibacter gergoviae]KMK28083.1 hypothetical protein ABW11_10035 [Pluralibacter gergoviae]MBK4114884.1 type 1 fimbrial protein [Pluralibacter gergoviae]MCK1065705.1 type 1 fimbrial protein [Pluralibacter gergoviae]